MLTEHVLKYRSVTPRRTKRWGAIHGIRDIACNSCLASLHFISFAMVLIYCKESKTHPCTVFVQ